LARFGVTNLFAALPERDNLFLLLREPEYLELYGRYMVEHHATPVRPEVVFTSDFFNVYAIRPAPGIDAAGGDLE
jgi:hypothetical protein